jgi:hypothetical protein
MELTQHFTAWKPGIKRPEPEADYFCSLGAAVKTNDASL